MQWLQGRSTEAWVLDQSMKKQLQKHSTFTRQIVVLFSGRRKMEPYATRQADKIEQLVCVS